MPPEDIKHHIAYLKRQIALQEEVIKQFPYCPEYHGACAAYYDALTHLEMGLEINRFNESLTLWKFIKEKLGLT